MSTLPTSAVTAHESSLARPARAGIIAIILAYCDLLKLRLNALVLVTAGVGFVLATPEQGIDWPQMIITMCSVASAAFGASAFNQLLEIARDRRMPRTMRRPLPTGALSIMHALLLALVLSMAGVIALAAFVNILAALLTLLTIVVYVALYTPMKPRSTMNTLVGAVAGALPPMIGWVAAAGSLSAGAWLLGALLFTWQLPHFLALAWLYREQYATGGFRMLPTLDPTGRLTARVILLTTFILLPLCLLMVRVGVAGWIFAIGALLLGVWMLFLAARFMQERSAANARKVFFASITYLPIVMALLVIDRGAIGGSTENMLPAWITADASGDDLREAL